MQTIEILTREHAQIRRLLGCLEELARVAEAAGRLDAGLAHELLDLLRHFVDEDHQEKEERVLFPALSLKSRARDAVVVRRLAEDHRDERRDLTSLSAHVLGASYAEPVLLRDFTQRARDYVEAQRRHLAHEEVVLFPMAERLLTSGEDRMLARALQSLATRCFGASERIRRLAERLGVSPVEEAGVLP